LFLSYKLQAMNIKKIRIYLLNPLALSLSKCKISDPYFINIYNRNPNHKQQKSIMKKIFLFALFLAVPFLVQAQKLDDVKPGMTMEDLIEIAGNPLHVIFIGIEKSSADSLFSFQYSDTQFVYVLGNKVESVEMNMNQTKLQVDSLINSRD